MVILYVTILIILCTNLQELYYRENAKLLSMMFIIVRNSLKIHN